MCWAAALRGVTQHVQHTETNLYRLGCYQGVAVMGGWRVGWDAVGSLQLHLGGLISHTVASTLSLAATLNQPKEPK